MGFNSHRGFESLFLRQTNKKTTPKRVVFLFVRCKRFSRDASGSTDLQDSRSARRSRPESLPRRKSGARAIDGPSDIPRSPVSFAMREFMALTDCRVHQKSYSLFLSTEDFRLLRVTFFAGGNVTFANSCIGSSNARSPHPVSTS